MILLGSLVHALRTVRRNRLLVPADLRFVTRERRQIIRQRLEQIEPRVARLAKLPLGVHAEVHAELHVVPAMHPGHVVEDLRLPDVVDLETRLATSEDRPVVAEIDFRQQARRGEQAIVISPLSANFVDRIR